MIKMKYKGKSHTMKFICGINVEGKTEIEIPEKFVKEFQEAGFEIARYKKSKKIDPKK